MAENKKRRIETSITRTINMGNYESIKIGCVLSTVIQDKADVTAEFEKLWKVCESELEAQSNNYEPAEPIDPDSRVAPGTETDTTKEVVNEPEDDITEEQILAMKKPELIKLIAKEKIEGIDTSMGVKALRVLVVEEMFEDDTPPDDTPPEPEEDGPEEDEIMAMAKPELIALIEKEKFEIDTSKSEKVLRVMIVDALFEDDEEAGGEVAGGTSGAEEPETGGTEGEPDGGEWKDDDWE